MSAKTTFTCNLCGHEIHALKPGQAETGTAVRWTSGKACLVRGEPWIDCGIHLCFTCVRAVGSLADEMRVLKMI